MVVLYIILAIIYLPLSVILELVDMYRILELLRSNAQNILCIDAIGTKD